jgi:hypothetical protein
MSVRTVTDPKHYTQRSQALITTDQSQVSTLSLGDSWLRYPRRRCRHGGRVGSTGLFRVILSKSEQFWRSIF